ncbi:CpsD/CapB family tyrosine-protein kinase [Peptococcaceae bacterium]|nr:CpsD/CapB family tyrosine-protein kinase [Peptococcaceae bacterium]MCL0100463.1 CpsD/CapB family tyrosine-protein kinase [Peptococcaceae bacterium]
MANYKKDKKLVAVDGTDEKIVALNDPKSPVAEMYRIIRTNIEFSCIDTKLQRLLITSPCPGEGKSITSANLAIVFAKAGKSVILLDADLRKPTQHRLFGVNNHQGLTNLLLGKVKVKDVLNNTPEPNLHLITSGPIPPNPAEILGSKKMSSILEELSSKVDLIIIDSPPVTVVTDTVLLSRKVDAVLLVLASKISLIEAAKKAKELLINAKANIIGTILNKVDEDSGGDYYYYRYYGSDEKN